MKKRNSKKKNAAHRPKQTPYYRAVALIVNEIMDAVNFMGHTRDDAGKIILEGFENDVWLELTQRENLTEKEKL